MFTRRRFYQIKQHQEAFCTRMEKLSSQHQEKNSFRPDWFCPITKEECNGRCVFYQKPYLSNLDSSSKDEKGISILISEWFCEDGYCKLAMIVSDIIFKIKKKQKEEEYE